MDKADKKRVKYYLVVTPFFPTPESFRGPFIYDISRAIERNSNYNVVVFKSETDSSDTGTYTYGGVTVHTFRTRETPSYLFNGFFNNHNARSLVSAVSAAGIDIKDVAVAHCHTASFGAYGLALKDINPNIKVLLQHHDLDPYTIRNGKFAGWIPNLLYRAKKNIKIFENIDYHVCVSEAARDSLMAFPAARANEIYESYLNRTAVAQRWIKRKPHIRRAEVLYNGVDCSIFHPIDDPQSAKPGKFVIGSIGNFVELKDQITLIKAVHRLIEDDKIRNIHLVLIGSGPLLDICKKYVTDHNLGEYIEFRSEVPHDKLCEFYNSLDLFVLPSFFEGFGCVFTEAAACGVPFMLCPGQGATEYIYTEDYDKWVFNVRDHADLASKIKNYITYRYTQRLRYPYDIDVLIKNFLATL